MQGMGIIGKGTNELQGCDCKILSAPMPGRQLSQHEGTGHFGNAGVASTVSVAVYDASVMAAGGANRRGSGAVVDVVPQCSLKCSRPSSTTETGEAGAVFKNRFSRCPLQTLISPHTLTFKGDRHGSQSLVHNITGLIQAPLVLSYE
jgi:hypothetical protein